MRLKVQVHTKGKGTTMHVKCEESTESLDIVHTHVCVCVRWYDMIWFFCSLPVLILCTKKWIYFRVK